MSITKNIADNLTAWMAESKTLKTEDAVADKAKVGFGTVRRCKKGEGNPTINNLVDIARAFGRPVADILAPTTTTIHSVNEPTTAADSYLASVRSLPPQEDQLINELLRLARQLSEPGLHRVIVYAEVAVEQFPKKRSAKGN